MNAPPRSARPETAAADLVGRRVRAYYNSRRRCWSLLGPGRRVAHADAAMLHLVSFQVRPGGRDRARREGRKNVHAFASGVLVAAAAVGDPAACGGRRVAYDYRRDATFVFADPPRSPVGPVPYLMLTRGGAFAFRDPPMASPSPKDEP